MQGITHHWQHRTIMTYLLLPFAGLFCVIAIARRRYYQFINENKSPLPVPVIVVGNVTVGGTGKSPFVIWLADYLSQQGYRPGIISRGYGGHATEWPQVVTPDSDPDQVGDEPVMIASRTACPMVVAPDRNLAARYLLENNDCNILISDDGMQHYRLMRNIEIAVVDGQRRFGNGYCLPAGPLREPVKRLQDVDMVVFNGPDSENIGVGQNKTGDHELTMQLEGNEAINLLDPEIRKPLAEFGPGTVHAIAGIGHPQRFFSMLERVGIQVEAHEFPDHHTYQQRDILFTDKAPVLMTEKDAVKCMSYAHSKDLADHWYVPVSAVPEVRIKTKLQNLLADLNGGIE